jgi:hypothetical protein
MPKVSESRYLVMAGWDDVPHLSERTKRELLASTPAHLRDARSRGIPVLGSGRIYPVAEELLKVPAFTIPKHWKRLVAIDFGWDHPFAAVWMALDPDTGIKYVTDCLRVREQTPILHAAAIKPRGEWIPVAWPHDGLQHGKGDGIILKRQYEAQGLNMLANQAQFSDEETDGETTAIRRSVEAGLLGILDDMQTGQFKVFDHLNSWFEEYRMYHRKDGKVVKAMDDLMDAMRYAWMTIDQHGTVAPKSIRNGGRNAGNWRTV